MKKHENVWRAGQGWEEWEEMGRIGRMESWLWFGSAFAGSITVAFGVARSERADVVCGEELFEVVAEGFVGAPGFGGDGVFEFAGLEAAGVEHGLDVEGEFNGADAFGDFGEEGGFAGGRLAGLEVVPDFAAEVGEGIHEAADGAGAADAKGFFEAGVVSGEKVEGKFAAEAEEFVVIGEFAAALFHGDDAGAGGDGADRFGLQFLAGDFGIVVEEEGHVRAFADGDDEFGNVALGHGKVPGSHDGGGGGAELFGGAGHFKGMAMGGVADVDEDGQAGADEAFDDLSALREIEVEVFAGGAESHETMDAGAEDKVEVVLEGGPKDFAAGIGGGPKCAEYAGKLLHAFREVCGRTGGVQVRSGEQSRLTVGAGVILRWLTQASYEYGSTPFCCLHPD